MEIAREGGVLQYRGYCSRGYCSRRRAARNWRLGFGALLNLPAP
jgi:hypothetical protein